MKLISETEETKNLGSCKSQFSFIQLLLYSSNRNPNRLQNKQYIGLTKYRGLVLMLNQLGFGRRGFTCMESTAAMVIISSEHPNSQEAKIILDINGSYIKIQVSETAWIRKFLDPWIERHIALL